MLYLSIELLEIIPDVVKVKGNSDFSPLQLQLSLDEAQSRLFEMERELNLLHKERDEAQNAAALLQSSVDQLTQVRIYHSSYACFINIWFS